MGPPCGVQRQRVRDSFDLRRDVGIRHHLCVIVACLQERAHSYRRGVRRGRCWLATGHKKAPGRGVGRQAKLIEVTGDAPATVRDICDLVFLHRARRRWDVFLSTDA